MAFACWEFANHPEMQQKVREEVLSIVNENEEVDLEKVLHLEYLDMFLYETIRRHCPVPSFTRGCTKDYKFANSNLPLKKNSDIVVPIAPIMLDER